MTTLASPVGTVLWQDGPTLAAEETFTQGDCWALSWALARLLEPMIGRGRLVTLGGRRGWNHVAVEVSEDWYLDFNGLSHFDELATRWGREPWPVPAWAEADFETYKVTYLDAIWEFEPGLATVEAFARLLLEREMPATAEALASPGIAA